jgi:hypothetical protein
MALAVAVHAGLVSHNAGLATSSLYPSQESLDQWLRSPVSSNYVGSACISFDGTDDFAAFAHSVTVTNALTIEFDFKSSSTGQTGYLFFQGEAGTLPNRAFGAIFASGALKVYIGNNQTEQAVGSANTYLDGAWHTLRIVSNGTTWNAYVDDSASLANGTVGGQVDGYGVRIGARSNSATDAHSLFYSGLIGRAVLDGIDVTCSEGYGSTLYGRAPAGNNGTITGPAWTTDDLLDPYNILYGFAAFTNGLNTIRVPYLADGSGPATNAVAGYALEALHPGGYVHNAAESSLILSDGSTNTYAELVSYAAVNTNGWNGTRWIKMDSASNITQVAMYSTNATFKPYQALANEIWFAGGIGNSAAIMSDGAYVTDESGNVTFNGD